MVVAHVASESAAQGPITLKHQHYHIAPPVLLMAAGPVTYANKTAIRLATPLHVPHLAFLKQHCVASQPLLPGAAFFEAMAAALHLLGAPQSTIVRDVAIRAPLVLSNKPQWMHVQMDGEKMRVTSEQGTHVTATVYVAHTHRQRVYPLVILRGWCGGVGAADVAADHRDGFLLPPGVLDSAMQLGQLFVRSKGPIVPVG